MRKSLVSIILFAATFGTTFAFAAGSSSVPQVKKPQSMPRYFEANRGQWPGGQEYRAYGFGYGVALGKSGVTLQVANPKEAKPLGKMDLAARTSAATKAAPPREVSLRFEGANSAAQLTGLEELDAKGAWFEGAEKDWKSGIPLFERVRLGQVYAGVDATFYGRDGALEYDLDVAAGAKTGALVFDLDGADGAAIGKNGDLTIEVNGQQIVLHKPLAWQPDGPNRKPVEVSYALLPDKGQNGRRIGLRMKGYDRSKPLTIDPVLTFATYLVSSASTQPDYYIAGIALDSLNNVYVLSTDASYLSMTVQKLTPAGVLVYTATFASSAASYLNLEPEAIGVNASGQAYVAADARGGYPTTSTAYQATYPNASYSGVYNGALSVLSADGSHLAYSTYFGGIANGSYSGDTVVAVAVDSAGNAYLAGQAGGDSFPTTTGAYQTTYSGGFPAAFVAKFNPTASGAASLVYSTLLGGAGSIIFGVAVDSVDDAYVSAYNSSCTYLPASSGAFAYSGIDTTNSCGYVTAVNPTGTGLVYSAYIGPGLPLAIAVDGSKDAYVVGDYIEADDFPTTPGAYQTSYPDGFAMELNPTGGLVYSTFLSGPSGGLRANRVNPASIALAPSCTSACPAYIAAATSANDFPVINGLGGVPPALPTNELEPAFVVLNGTGSAALTSGYLSGLNSFDYYASYYPYPYVAVDTLGNAWLTGSLSTNSAPDFPVTTTTAPGPNGSWLAEVSMTNAGNVIAYPQSVSFGASIPVNVSSTAYDALTNLTPTTVVLRNMGSAAVTISSVIASPSVFTESDNCNGQIAAASYCTATIVFTPTSDNPVNGTLTIASSGIQSPLIVPLSGQGADVGFIQATPASLSFGNQIVNLVSAPQTITLTNVGDEPLSLSGQIYFYTGQRGFNQVNDCPGTISPGASCQVQVTFAPGIAQVGLQSTFVNYGGQTNADVPVSGTGVLPSGSGGTVALAFSGTTFNFGTEAVGSASGNQYLYLTNTGSLPLAFLPPTITLTSSQGAASDFQIANEQNISSLAPQAYGYFLLSFTPSAAATETATLSFPVVGSSTVFSVNLVGQGAADTQTLEFEPANAVFPDQVVGTTSPVQYFYLFNAGDSPFLVDRVVASGDFSVTGGNCPGSSLTPSIAPGDVTGNYCFAEVAFTPSQAGARAGTLTVYDAASQTPQTFPLMGNGIAAVGSVSVDPTILPFGTLVKGTTSSEQVVTVTNTGNVPVNLTAMTTTGDYAVTGNNFSTLPCTMAPGASCSVIVTFTPTVTTSPDNGTLTLTTTAGTVTTTLTGAGEAGTLASGLSPTSISFGNWENGYTTNWIPLYVRNTGTKTLTFSAAATVTGDFAIPLDYCNTGGSGTLAPGQDCYMYVYFAPVATGTLTGTLTVKSNAGTLTASLSGFGTAVAAGSPTYFAPPAESFDQQAVNSVSAPITVNFNYNGGIVGFALTGASITAGSANFQLATGVNALNTCAGASPGTTTCQVNVVYAPTAAGYETGTLTVATNVGSFAVKLSGYAPPLSDTAYVSPGQIDFPAQVVSTTTPSYFIYQVILNNTSDGLLTVGTVTGTNYGTSGTPLPEFQTVPGYDTCSGATLATADSQSGNAGSCYVDLQFTPNGAGTRTGTISFPVTFADGTTNTYTANLTGAGIAQYNEAVLSPTVVPFPDTAVGTTNPGYYQSIYLTNSGNLPFTVGILSGTDTIIAANTSDITGDFTDVGPNLTDQCSNATVTPGTSCLVNVGFKPASAGAKTGTVTFPVTYANTSTPVNFTATLTGNAVAASATVAVSPAGIQFAPVTAGGGNSNNYQLVTVTNTGNVPVTLTSAALSTGFGFYSDGCTSPAPLAPGSSCTDYVYFNPSSSTTGTVTGTLTIHDTATGSPQTVSLKGTSLVASNELVFSQTTVPFGNQQVSTASGQITVYLVNQGTTAVTINSIALAGSNPGDFTESDGCAGNNLPANSTCPIYLKFAPTAAGARSATLKETDSGAGGPRTITLTGTGTNPGETLTIFPSSLAFSAQQPVSVTSTGVNPVAITAVTTTDATEYPITQDGCTGNNLTTGESCIVGVLFAPTSTGSHTATIKITDNAPGSPQSVPLTGTGITELTSSVTLAANPTSVAFGTAVTLTATVKDQNSNPLTNGSVTFLDGTTALGTVQVVRTTEGGGVIGTATLKTILIPLGANSITAKYVGGDVTSTSAAVVVTVTGKYPTTTTIATSGSAGDYTFTGTIVGGGPFGVPPTGNILFTDTTTGLMPGTAGVNAATLTQSFVPGPAVNGLASQGALQKVAFADVNGDGIPDMVISVSGDAVMVCLGNGDGSFQQGQVFGNPNSGAVYQIAFGDFNGDGKLDIALATFGPTYGIDILLGNGDGTFQLLPSLYDNTNYGYIISLAVGDFNGDGKLDILGANYENNTLDLFLGNGDGTFQQPLYTATGGAVLPTHIVAADFNGDGKLDVAVDGGGGSSGRVSILLGDGNGFFHAPAYTPYGGSQPAPYAAADLNGDGKLDLVTIDNNSVGVWLGNGDGTFQAEQTVFGPAGDLSGGLSLADLNGDGKLDIAIPDTANNLIDILWGKGDGTFPGYAAYPGVFTPNTGSLALADLNHDGKTDIVAVGANSSTNQGAASVLLNQVTQQAVLTPTLAPGTGTHAITAAYSSDANYAASTSQPAAVTASLVTPTMQLAALPSSTVAWGVALSVKVTLTGPYGWVPAPTGMVSYTIDGGTAQSGTLVAGIVTIPISQLSVANHTIAVSYLGDQYYASLSAQNLPVTIIKANQTINFTAPTTPVTYGVAPVTLVATGGASGNPVVFTIDAVSTATGTISGNMLTITGAGTLQIDANQAGNADYNAATQVHHDIGVNKAAQTITFTPPATPVTYGVAPITLVATGGGSGIAVVFTVDATSTGTGTISGSTLTVTGAGTLVIDANQAGNTNYNAAPQVQQTITVNKAAQTINFTAPATPVTYGVSPITLVATGGGSGVAVVFTIDATSTGTGTVSGSTLTVTGAGTLVIDANQAGNTNYTAAPQVQQTITVNKAAQTIAFTAPASPVTYGVSPITLAATGGGSGVAVVFTIDATSTGTGTISGNTLTVTGAGTLVIDANQAGNANYNAAPQVQKSITVNKAAQTIAFTAPTTPVAFGVSPITLAATGGASTNPVVFTIDASSTGTGTISGNTLTVTGVGNLVIDANQAGNGNYNAATQVQKTIIVNKAAQTIAFTPPATPVTYPVSPITLVATGGASGNPVVFTVDASSTGTGTISGATLTITGAGTVVIDANQAANADYAAATQVQQSIVVQKAVQTIAFTPPATPVTYGVSPITLVATGGASGNAVVFTIDATSTGTGTISGSTLTITGAGTVLIDANQAASSNYAAATQVQQSIVVQKAPQTISFTLPASETLGSGPITLTATGGASGNAVTFSLVSGPGSISGSMLTITGVGQIIVAANQAGNANYLAAAQVTQSVSVNLGAITSPVPGSALTGSSATFTWVAGSGVTDYQLALGTTGLGSSNLYLSPLTTGTSVTVTGLPELGATIYAQLGSKIGGTWYYAQYTYAEAPPPVVTLSATSIAFGNQLVGTTSGSLSVTMTNTGGSTLSISSIVLTGANASSFAFSNSCGTSLAAGANCTIHGHFAPAVGGAMTASIVITDNASGSPQTIAVTGTGGTSISLSPTGLAFGSEEIGVASPSQTVTMTNTGAIPLTISSIAVTGANASSFIFSNGCGTSVAVGANCTIHGHFTPNASGPLTAAITITDNATYSPQTIPLSGSGVEANSTTVSLSATTVTFGIQEIGTISPSQDVTLTNTGTTALFISGVSVTGPNATSFAFASSCGTTVAPGANCLLHGHFAPVAAGALTATFNVTDTATGSPQTITLNGTGVALNSTTVSLSPPSLTFASQAVGTASAAQSVTLTNTGSNALAVTGVTVTGSGAASFAFSSSCGTGIAAGASCTIHGHFAPTTTGTITASVNIIDSATGSPQSVALTGTGH